MATLTLYTWNTGGSVIYTVIPVQRHHWRSGMIPERKTAWCTALRSGRWEQVFGAYVTPRGRCAMGVLRAIASLALYGKEYYPLTVSEPEFFQNMATWLGLTEWDLSIITSEVVHWNDEERLSFAEIADLIERGTW